MHILHLIKTSEGATWAYNLIKLMKEKYPDVSFSVVLPAGGKHFDQYQLICRNVYILDYTIGFSTISNGLKLRKFVKQDCPDVIHSWFVQTTLYARLFLRDIKIPRIFQVVGPLHLENGVFKFFDIFSSNVNDYWIATSAYIYNKYHKAGIKQEKLLLNYALVDLDKLQDDMTKPILNLKSLYNIPEGAKIIGTASYIYPPGLLQKKGIKGHEILMECFSQLIKERDDIYLVIAGSTFGNDIRYALELEKLANKISDKIIFTGRYTNVYSVIANFDVFVYLSRSENLGGVYESLYYEIPTISSDRGALPELVENNVTGYNCSLDDVNDIVNKINFLLADSKRKSDLQKNGKDRVIQFFNKINIVDKTYNIYKNLTSITTG